MNLIKEKNATAIEAVTEAIKVLEVKWNAKHTHKKSNINKCLYRMIQLQMQVMAPI